MSFKGFAGKFVDEAKLNPNIGMFSYVLHRITGIGLAVYLIMHTWVLSSARHSPEQFTGRLGSVQTPIFHFLEIFLVAAVFLHMFNGIRIIIADFFSMTRRHRTIQWIMVVLFIAVMIWGVVAVLPRLFGH
jgi:succinate dehydrogenase / fumarate reductase cytochrome b subunit